MIGLFLWIFGFFLALGFVLVGLLILFYGVFWIMLKISESTTPDDETTKKMREQWDEIAKSWNTSK